MAALMRTKIPAKRFIMHFSWRNLHWRTTAHYFPKRTTVTLLELSRARPFAAVPSPYYTHAI